MSQNETVDLDRLPEYLAAVRTFTEAQGDYNPAALAALHWGDAAVAEIRRLRALLAERSANCECWETDGGDR